MLGGIGATVAANVAYGLPGGLTDALLSVWAVLAYVGAMELLTWMRENLGASKKATARNASAEPAVSTSASAGADAPSDELRDRRERRTGQAVGDLLTSKAAGASRDHGGDCPAVMTWSEARRRLPVEVRSG